VKIERNVPVPEKFGKPLGYPWPAMQICDSILVNVAKCGPSGQRAHKSWATKYAKVRFGESFSALCERLLKAEQARETDRMRKAAA